MFKGIVSHDSRQLFNLRSSVLRARSVQLTNGLGVELGASLTLRVHAHSVGHDQLFQTESKEKNNGERASTVVSGSVTK